MLPEPSPYPVPLQEEPYPLLPAQEYQNLLTSLHVHGRYHPLLFQALSYNLPHMSLHPYRSEYNHCLHIPLHHRRKFLPSHHLFPEHHLHYHQTAFQQYQNPSMLPHGYLMYRQSWR